VAVKAIVDILQLEDRWHAEADWVVEQALAVQEGTLIYVSQTADPGFADQRAMTLPNQAVQVLEDDHREFTVVSIPMLDDYAGLVERPRVNVRIGVVGSKE
jgi:hypothetical protein